MLLTNLTCFNRRNPIGIGATPYFGWKIESDNQDTMQRSYHIIVNDADGHNVWDSGIIFSERNAFIPYQGEPLKGCMPYRWQIEICDNHNCTATADAQFETAILDRADWKAQWVASPFRQRRKKSGRQPVVFLNHFTLLRNVASAGFMRQHMVCLHA
jgi:alpha-L-rhamnosidase